MPIEPGFSSAGSLFGISGNLFGPNTPAPQPTTERTLQALPAPTRSPSTAPRPRTLTTLPGATEQVLVKDAPAEAERLPPPVELAGSLAAVRAAQVTHMHEDKLWQQDRLPATIGSSTAPDLTDAEIDSRYQTLQLFSYLPPQLALSRDEFAAMLRPSARAGYLASNLSNMGINTGSTLLPAQGTLAAAAALPDNAPFAEQLAQFCDDKFFTLEFV